MSDGVADAVRTLLYQWFQTFPNLKQHLGESAQSTIDAMVESWVDLLGDLSPSMIQRAGRQALAHQVYPSFPTPGAVRQAAYDIMGTTTTRYLEDRRRKAKMQKESEQLERQLAGEGQASLGEWRDAEVSSVGSALGKQWPELTQPNEGDGDAPPDGGSAPVTDHAPDCACETCAENRQSVERVKQRTMRQLEHGDHDA